ncbi:MAG: hypothetical protein IPP48_00985 [Chitinophagaceae bacterium]|nr:hypothetical protein [Chitinophagaceae bacterium]
MIDYTHRYVQSYPTIKLQVGENFSGTKRLNSNEALQHFRICQEVITNACKYSESEMLEIEGQSTDNKFSIKIKDNGIGFDLQAIQDGEHYGVKNIQKRAEVIKAAISINAAMRKGVEVKITI